MRIANVVVWASCLLSLLGCGSSSSAPDRFPYKVGQTDIIGGDFDNPDGLAERTVATPGDAECIDLDSVCVKPPQECAVANARADVLIDADGQVADVVCYPTGGVSVESFEGPVHDVGNNVVLVLDGVDDAADVVGDVTIDGNNVTLYGHGPDTSLIDGNLNVAKNNSLVRGVRVAGDVTISKNDTSLVDCVIEGNLTITGNNTALGLCEVWGATKITGNNTVLVANAFSAAPEIEGKNTRCSLDVTFQDADGDHVVSASERGPTVDCTDHDASKTPTGNKKK